MKFSFIYILILLLAAGCGNDYQKRDSGSADSARPEVSKSDGPERLEYEVVRTIPHNGALYTQGLQYFEGFLYESTGIRGESALKKIDPATGEVLRSVELPAAYFGEGMTIYQNKIYILTWTSGKCLVYDFDSFRPIGEMDYPGQGWGLCLVGDRFAMSDGTNTIRMVSPEDFRILETLPVYSAYRPVERLNELEYAAGKLWANVYLQDVIVRIDPGKGKVEATLDLSGLRDYLTITPDTEVLNGIARDEAADLWYVTGKNWNLIFVLKIK
ncbi:MAG: glutaminyl-peptide cyclotransferase [Candidatus Kapaibacterium sp.]